MTVFLDSQAALFQTGNAQHPQLQAWREQALAEAIQIGFPNNKREAWKYAPLRALANKPFSQSNKAAITIDPQHLPPAPRWVFINGVLNTEYSDCPAIDGLQWQTLNTLIRGSDSATLNFFGRTHGHINAPFSALNTALATDGLVLQVAEHAVIESPVHLVFIGHGSGSQYLRHRIECLAHSQLSIIEHHLSADEHNGLHNHLMHVDVGPHAKLSHVRIQQHAAAALSFSHHEACLADHANYQRLDIEHGSHFSRQALQITLQGEHACVQSSGVLWAHAQNTLDTRLCVNHQAPNSQCQLLWRGLGDDKARVNFYGAIHIAQGADGSNAALSNKNLLLSPHAQINTQPALEIYADEVKAAHGATVGQLDNQALFYLRARGVPYAEAQKLLTQAFYAEAFEHFAQTALLEQLTPYLPPIIRQHQEHSV